MLKKSEKPYGTLYLCGTPIGNLDDVSMRLIGVLKQVDLVACEDTRRTLKLLSYFGIKKPLLSLHQHVERKRTDMVISALSQGKSVAFVSDAGMPVISDPGAYLVRTAREKGFPMILIPGPSAVTSALTLSGFLVDKFIFAGFPPRKAKQRQKFFLDWIRPKVPVVFFEAPHRLVKSLSDLMQVFPDIEVCLCHEMTKVHESTVAGSIAQVYSEVKDSSPQGEWVIVALLREGKEKEQRI